MSHANRRSAAELRARARVFAALGDETRLLLVTKLSGGRPRSITELTEGSNLTRQAISKHLRVLKRAEMVDSVRTGRESRFELDPHSIVGLRNYLDQVSEQWDQALLRLKRLVED